MNQARSMRSRARVFSTSRGSVRACSFSATCWLIGKTGNPALSKPSRLRTGSDRYDSSSPTTTSAALPSTLKRTSSVPARRATTTKRRPPPGGPLQRCWSRGDLIAEIVGQVDAEAGRQQLGRCFDGGIDLEVEVLGKPRVFWPAQLVGVAAFHDPSSRRSRQQPTQEAVDRDHEVDPTRDDAGVAGLLAHPDEEAGSSSGRCSTRRGRHSPAPSKGGRRRSSSRSPRLSIARSRASRAAEIS